MNAMPSGMPDVPAVAWLVPLFAFLTLIAIVGLVLYAGARRDRTRHETIRAMIDKGTPIPQELLVPPKRSDLRRGIVLVAAGLGLSVFFLAFPVQAGLWAVGSIPALVGLGYLVAWRLERPSQ
jgi:hypothetical protein